MGLVLFKNSAESEIFVRMQPAISALKEANTRGKLASASIVEVKVNICTRNGFLVN